MSDERIDNERARELIASDDARVIDLRDEEEFGEVHVPGAERVPDDADAEAFASELDDDAKVIVFCEDGERSASFAAELREHGVEAASVEGGIKGWTSDEMPTQPSVDFQSEASGPPKLPGSGT